MQTSVRSSRWAWTLPLLGSLLVCELTLPAQGQTVRPANPLRASQTSPAAGSPSRGSAPRSSVSKTAFDQPDAPRSVGFVPKHEKLQPRGYRPVRNVRAMQEGASPGRPTPARPIPIPAEPLPLAPGERIVGEPVWEGDIYGDEIYGDGLAGEGIYTDSGPGLPMPMSAAGPPMGGCAGPGCGGSGCGGDGCVDCCVPCPLLPWHNLELLGGVHGFTGAANRGETASFGFHYGLNWGTPLPIGALSGQVGVELVHSNFSGAEFTDDGRNQVFLTGGIFRRVDWGLQGGLVVDYMRDDWYLELDLTQLRGELSWVFPNCHELGFWFTASTKDHSTQGVIFEDFENSMVINESYETNDLYAFFYRRRFNDFGGEGRIFAGFSGESDGLLGVNLRLPISHRLAVRGDFTYLIPEDRIDSLDHRDENWNVGLSLVWHLGPPAVGCHRYSQPLFNVANNGTFLIRRR